MQTFVKLNPDNQLFNDINFNEKLGQEVDFFGIVHNTRISKWGGFVIIRKGFGLLQCVFNIGMSVAKDIEGNEILIKDLKREASVRIKGKVIQATIKDAAVFHKDIEIQIVEIALLSEPETTQLIDTTQLAADSAETFVFKLDNRHISLRNVRDMAIFKIQSEVAKSFSDFCKGKGFTQIYTPKIVSAGAEGGANIFELEYFGKKAYLAQSPQFYKQICVAVFEKVFEVAPVYRAEKHNTSRHLNEYISLDVELGFIDSHVQLMELETAMMKFILTSVEKNCAHELRVLNTDLPKLPDQIPSYRLSEVHEILHKHYSDKLSQDHRGEPDLAPEEEVLICDYASKNFSCDFVFVTHFPRSHRAFYSFDDPEDKDLTLSFDLLMKGKEITSGSKRVHKESEYIKKMNELGMDPNNFSFYLETFRQGMPPHGGFAIGLERFVACMLDLQNVKEASLFPRDVGRITP